MPLREPPLRRFRQELFLEQTAMNDLFPRYPERIAPTPPLQLFEGFGGKFVRHGAGIKDQAFVLALRDALVSRVMSPVTHAGPGPGVPGPALWVRGPWCFCFQDVLVFKYAYEHIPCVVSD